MIVPRRKFARGRTKSDQSEGLLSRRQLPGSPSAPNAGSRPRFALSCLVQGWLGFSRFSQLRAPRVKKGEAQLVPQQLTCNK